MQIDVYGDVVCPFCYIGLKRVADLAGERNLDIRWLPFQLQPEMPREGKNWPEFAVQKFGGEASMRSAFAHVEQYACDDALCFRFDQVASAPNTVNAHRVILCAEEQGLGVPVAMSLMRGYFEEGAELGDPQTLAALAERAGLSGDAVRELLAGDRFAPEVRQSQQLADQRGVQGVPFYVLNGQYALSGAQSAETMRAALDWVNGQRANEKSAAPSA